MNLTANSRKLACTERYSISRGELRVKYLGLLFLLHKNECSEEN